MIDIGKWGENVQMERGTEEEKGEGGKGKEEKQQAPPPIGLIEATKELEQTCAPLSVEQ